jgi:hypothetical protein
MQWTCIRVSMVYNEDITVVTKTAGTISFFTLPCTENHCIKRDFFSPHHHNKEYVTSHHCFPITVCTNCTHSFSSEVNDGWQSVKVPLTHLLCTALHWEEVQISESDSNLSPPSFNPWEMYIMRCVQNFVVRPIACFIASPIACLVYGGTMQYLSRLVTQVSTSSELPLSSDKEITEYNYMCICLRFCPLSNSVWFFVTLVMTFLHLKHFTLSWTQI